MSAINACLSESGDAAYMLTDTAVYYIAGDRAGEIVDFHEKVTPFPELKMALATCGAPEIRDLFGAECRRFSTFDEAVEQLPGVAREMSAAGYFTRVFDDPEHDANKFRLIVVGWSDARRKPEIYVMQNQRAPAGAGAAWAPFSLQKGQRILLQPGGVTLEDLAGLGFVKGGQVRYGDPAVFLTNVIHWQRLNCSFGEVGPHRIGGHATLTRIDRSGITQRVVHQWPEDRIGERIVPSPAESQPAPIVAPEGLSRLQRHRFEKRQKKIRARVGA